MPSATRRCTRATLILGLAALLIGCGSGQPVNPTFPVTSRDAREALEQLEAAPRPLDRPVLVLGGIFDPGLAARDVVTALERTTSDDAIIIQVTFIDCLTFDACRARLFEVINYALADPDDPRSPIDRLEFDVVAFSMGGLVARYAAIPQHTDPRVLRINRLFTIASPHRGAALADLPSLDQRVLDMQRGSAFIALLDRAWAAAPYDIYPYVRLGDAIVGTENASPPGVHPWWVPNPLFGFSHLAAGNDPRIIGDICLRLRGEPAWSITPAAPLPHEQRNLPPAVVTELQLARADAVAARGHEPVADIMPARPR